LPGKTSADKEMIMTPAQNFAKSIVRDAYARGNPTINVGNLKNNGLAKICGVMISAYAYKVSPETNRWFLE
jgi:hypothetical protein